MAINRTGHMQVRHASGGQFKVYEVAGNGEITKISERLTSHANCIGNIVSGINTCNGTGAEVRDYTNPKFGLDAPDYKVYMVRANGTIDTNFPHGNSLNEPASQPKTDIPSIDNASGDQTRETPDTNPQS